MSTEMQTKVQASPAQNFTPVQTGLLQRKSALCNTPGLVEDSKQDKEKLTLQHSSADQAGTTTVPRFGHDFSRVSVHSNGPGMIQTKLKINEPGDIYEQEANRVAEQVLQMPEPRLQRQVEPDDEEEETLQTKPLAAQIMPLIQRQIEPEEEKEEEELIQAKLTSGQAPQVSQVLQNQIHSLRGGGQPLSPPLRNFFEPRFGHDFKRVRIHSGVKAAESAWAIDALAYAVGQDVAFAEGKYRPDTNAGKSLIAHELAHVVQQDRESFDSHPEDRADLSARQVLEGQAVSSSLVGGAPYGLYRQRTETSKEEKKKPGEKAGKEQKVIVPAINPSEKKTETPEMPSRLPIPWLSGGSFSFGLHLGFPKLAEETELQKKLLGGRPDFLKESLQHAQVINQMLTGKVPTGWEEADKGELARYVWEIFSRNIAPDLAAKITSGLSTSTGPAGLSYELDLLLITDFSKEIGGGASFTVRW